MRTLDLKQGSPEWLAYRATARNASDAAAMLGCSPYQTRSELLHVMHTGLRADVSPEQQRIFDRGHAIEASKRPVAEAIIGEELFPVVSSETIDGIELSASFDGLTMMDDTNWECKSLNENLRNAMRNQGLDENDGIDLPKHYRVQMQQQCMVSGCTRVLFTASDGQDDDRHCWYYSHDALGREIIAGWKQFDIDLAAYVPPAAAPVLVAAAQETLPAVSVQLNGSIAVIDNLESFGTALTAYIDKINKTPQTDQDFVDLKAVVATLERAEAALDAAETSALASIASVNAMQSTISTLRTLTKQNRLLCDRIYKAENDRRKLEIIQGGKEAFTAHIAALNERLGKPYMPAITPDFAGVAKNLRTLASLQNAVDTELARVKIESSATADRLQANLTVLRETAADYAFLFADTAQIVLKATDDFKALVENRIAGHKQAEADRLEKERERIRGEEVARLAREAAVQPVATTAPAPVVVPAAVVAILPTGGPREAMSGNVVPLTARAVPAPATPPTLKLGDISERLGFTLTTDFLKTLGFEPAAVVKAAKLFHEHQYPLILAALVGHIQSLQAKQAA